jgi:hypothetical protein
MKVALDSLAIPSAGKWLHLSLIYCLARELTVAVFPVNMEDSRPLMWETVLLKLLAVAIMIFNAAFCTA